MADIVCGSVGGACINNHSLFLLSLSLTPLSYSTQGDQMAFSFGFLVNSSRKKKTLATTVTWIVSRALGKEEVAGLASHMKAWIKQVCYTHMRRGGVVFLSFSR